jgi:hypothetical protein
MTASGHKEILRGLFDHLVGTDENISWEVHKRLADGVYGKAAPLYASERHGGCQLDTTARVSDLAESQRHDQFIPVRKEDLFSAVCTENVVRIDLVTESPNHPGRWSRCYPFFSIC